MQWEFNKTNTFKTNYHIAGILHRTKLLWIAPKLKIPGKQFSWIQAYCIE